MATKTKSALSRLERFILDKLSTNGFNKIRAWIQRIVQRYDKYLLARHLEEKTKKLVERDNADLLEIKSAILKNQAYFIIEKSQVDITKATGEHLDTLEIASKVVDELYNLNDLIGLQPLSAPVGLVYQLRYKNNVSSTAGDTISLEVVSHAVASGSRRVQAGYTVEAMHDLKSMHDFDLASELTKAIGAEIGYELISEVLNDLVKLGEISIDEDALAEVMEDSNTSVKFSDIISEINKAAFKIATKTRRGAGNVIVCSPVMISMLQSISNLKFEIDNSSKFKGPTELIYVGTLNDTYRVYSSMHLQFHNKILVAYKGNNGQCDTGYILSPYIPVVPTGLSMDKESFQPFQRFITRYGKSAMTTDEASFSLSQNYYRTIDVSKFIDAFAAPY